MAALPLSLFKERNEEKQNEFFNKPFKITDMGTLL